MMSLRVAVLGSPGHGKSTFLNCVIGELAKDESLGDLFKVGCNGLESVTKKVSDFQFDAKVWRKIDFDGQLAEAEDDKVALTLIDTMGFPDPKKAVAAKYYDEVVTKAVNNPDGLNAVVWVLKHDRPDEEAMKRWSILMNQLASCSCKFIVVVNGMENYTTRAYKKMSPEELQRKQEDDRTNMFASCKKLLEDLGISKGDDDVERMITIIPSTHENELEEIIPRKLMAEIIDSECVCSSVHTYKSMRAAYETEEKAREEQQRCANEARRKRENAKMAFERELERIQTLKAQELERLKKEKDAEAAAENERQKAKDEAQKLLDQQKEAEEKKNAAKSERSILEEKKSGTNREIERLTRLIEEQLDEIDSLSKAVEEIWDDYAFAFGESGVVGRIFLGGFTAGGSELYLASSRSKAYSLVAIKEAESAQCEKQKERLVKQREALAGNDPDFQRKVLDAQLEEKVHMAKIKEKEDEYKKKQQELEEQETKRRQAQANATQYQERLKLQEEQIQGKMKDHNVADAERAKEERIRMEELRIQSEKAKEKKDKVDDFARYLGEGEDLGEVAENVNE